MKLAGNLLRHGTLVVLSLSLGTLGSGTASAAWTLTDDFNRPNSNVAGGGWVEREYDGQGGNDFSGNQPRLEIDNNTLKLTTPVYEGPPSSGFTCRWESQHCRRERAEPCSSS